MKCPQNMALAAEPQRVYPTGFPSLHLYLQQPSAPTVIVVIRYRTTFRHEVREELLKTRYWAVNILVTYW